MLDLDGHPRPLLAGKQAAEVSAAQGGAAQGGAAQGGAAQFRVGADGFTG